MEEEEIKKDVGKMPGRIAGKESGDKISLKIMAEKDAGKNDREIIRQ